MKTVLSLASLSSALLVAGLVQAADPSASAASAAAAASPPTPPAAVVRTATPLSLAEVHQRLLAAGYRNVTELERKHDHVEAEARDRDGRRVELELDPSSAAVLHSEVHRFSWRAAPQGLDMGQLLAQLEAAGYRHVREIEIEHDEVEVKAEDAQGLPVKLRLDPRTGAPKSARR